MESLVEEQMDINNGDVKVKTEVDADKEDTQGDNVEVTEKTEIATNIKQETDSNSRGESDDLSCENDGDKQDRDSGHGAVVAAHYNTLEEKGLRERNQSRIVHLRNFNNWIKSMLINEFLGKVRDSKSTGAPLKVLDMCCGKGGDLFKWRNGKITHLVCVDLAETSVKQCQKRFEDIQERMRRERNYHCFTAEFLATDCTKVRLRTLYNDSSLALDLVSCQFSFHYSFESLAQAECMLQNAAECLQPGGYFIGTMPDANEIMARQDAAKSSSFGNDVYKISFENDKPYPLFGGKYDFRLEGVVNCPEFLVHFPTLEKLAKKYGLQKIKKEKFEDFFKRMRGGGNHLLGKMQALETFPPRPNSVKLAGNEDLDYEHAKDHIKQTNKNNLRVGTLSSPEWEAATLYLVFAFEKMERTWDSDGKPVYTPFVQKSRKRNISDKEAGAESSSKIKKETIEET